MTNSTATAHIRDAVPFGPLHKFDAEIGEYLHRLALAGTWGRGATLHVFNARGRYLRTVTTTDITYVSDDVTGETVDYYVDAWHAAPDGKIREYTLDGSEYGRRWRYAASA